ncbi:TATA-binding protein-associated factor 172-like [Lineus longissimus]|uniref:TATA-binding protein-associated factor 172-like n=1 Tax=Lineus longissimus TaxID=88925 RepID=UPI002B4DD975
MTTRLDRLFLLLDTGSTPVIRKSAAEQLGEVQKLHPHELHNLLAKVHCYLRSSSWETRIAAGHAVCAIAKHVPKWEPQGAPKEEESCCKPLPGQLTVSGFNIEAVLMHAASLLGSEGMEYDTDEETKGMDPKDKVTRQRQLLNKRLGLDVAGGMGLAPDDLFKDEDLMEKPSESPKAETVPQKAISELVEQHIQQSGGHLSAREKNRAKRKAKLLVKQISKDPTNGNGDSNSDCDLPPKKRKMARVLVPQPSSKDKVLLDNVMDSTVDMDDCEDWPFDGFCELLIQDLFHSSWEFRHGAATGLREVIKLHGLGAGKSQDMPSDQLSTSNEFYLEDLALRLLCVLALDRFGDFVSDEVVAPVRETCAQALGATVKCLSCDGVAGILNVLLQLLKQRQWEVRHGGLLGIKYLLAVRQEMTSDLLPKVLNYIFQGLQDHDDDVRAVAATSLLPVATQLATLLPQQIPLMVYCLWNTLLELDDLTSSTNSIMSLLAALLQTPAGMVAHSSNSTLTEFVPRLWPFLRHSIASVRKCALETLYTILCQEQSPIWLIPILQDALRHIYQRSLLEHKAELLEIIYKVWCKLIERSPHEYLIGASMPWLAVWLCLIMQPSIVPFERALLIEAKHKHKDPQDLKGRPIPEHLVKEAEYFIGGNESMVERKSLRDQHVMGARLLASRLLGFLCSHITRPPPPPKKYPEGMETPLEAMAKLLLFHLDSKSALQRFAIASVVREWAMMDKDCPLQETVKSRIQSCLTEAIYFDEIAVLFTRMQNRCQEFMTLLGEKTKVEVAAMIQAGPVLTVEQANSLCNEVFNSMKDKLQGQSLQLIDEKRLQLLSTVSQTSSEQQTLSMRAQTSLAGALVSQGYLPDKMNPVIRPLMDTIKKEENCQLQKLAAKNLAFLLNHCIDRTPCPNAKVVKNLCSFLCSDPSTTPVVNQSNTNTDASSVDAAINCDVYSGILTLSAQARNMDVGRKRTSKKESTFTRDIPTDILPNGDQGSNCLQAIQRRGAELALTIISKHFGAHLDSQVPNLWSGMLSALSSLEKDKSDLSSLKENDSAAQELVNSLQVLETVGAELSSHLYNKLLAHITHLCTCLEHPYTAVRHMAARCLGTLAKLDIVTVMTYTIEHILPLFGASDNVTVRQGALETLHYMIDHLGVEIVPYTVLLVVPVLGRMTDQNESVRLMATQCFAMLIRLMPLEAGIPDPPDLKKTLVDQKDRERRFLEQLMETSKLEDYKVPVKIDAELRKYQQDGVNWLAFLNKYKLHGILCDDMGLGKTLQSICILAGDHFYREQKYQETKHADCVALPSLVVCPPTLTGHWVYEVEKFVDKEYLNPLHYTGTPQERQRLRSKVKKHNIVIASYDIVRNDLEFFGAIDWNYCILDEGHTIKNSKTKLTKAVKQLNCNHRLILSGTPIQNNVLELWSLFDFLMPGFLGTERQFQARYGKPIIQSRDAKSSSKEQEAGVLAMESLHRQVLPFLLRRLKEDVLQDLPPKIIQDYYCDLSPLQVQLYEDFSESKARENVNEDVLSSEQKVNQQKATHVFQALQYLRKVCNHPALVLTSKHPQFEKVTAQLAQKNNALALNDINHSSKLVALKQLLLDCGIGVASSVVNNLGDFGPIVNQHRVLLFCQLKSMLDIVEHDLFKVHMPSVTYLRLDGSVPAGTRHGLVSRFNNDPSIDVLLLTTHVGGLGLNLTGADTVIFVEHDWNPMKDLQAMDRAHRIGQKKVVNVYRLITRGTLEEKIMGLQKFKINIANTIISQDNSSLQSMGTDQLLDLFTLEENKKGANAAGGSSKEGTEKDGAKNVIDSLEELWDEKQYEDEYNLDNFISSLSN